MIFQKALAILFACLICTSVSAQSQSSEDRTFQERLAAAAEADNASRDFLKRLAQYVANGSTSATRRRIYSPFYEMAPEGELTAEKIEAWIASENAKRRASRIGRNLAIDLDGDGILDQDERAAVVGRIRPEIDELFEKADRNGDGQVSFSEMSTYAQEEVLSRGSSNELRHYMLFDLDNDGTVTPSEIATFLEKLAELPDLNLSNVTVFDRASDRVQCTAPRPNDETQLIVVSGYEGSAMSTVSTVGMDAVTQLARLTIEDGNKPLYIYLTAENPVIWELSGATDRISRVVVQKSDRKTGPGAGVIGVDKDKVAFVETETCSSAYMTVKGSNGIAAYRTVAKNIGRDPDVFLSSYAIGNMSVPSGENTSRADEESGDLLFLNGRTYQLTPGGPKLLDQTQSQLPDDFPFGATLTYQSLLRFQPDGIRSLDPSDVISPGEVVSYDVMPREAGLLQLVLDGRITYTRDGFYRIDAPIERFPAGLFGAHHVRFTLSKGLELPTGTPGHSSVYSLEKGECIVGRCPN